MKRNLIIIIVLAFFLSCANKGHQVRPIHTPQKQPITEHPQIAAIKTDSNIQSASRAAKPDWDRFQKAYKKANFPRFCLFVNKELSQATAEWSKSVRFNVKEYSNEHSSDLKHSNKEYSVDQSNVSIANPSTRARVLTNRFMTHFRKGGVRFVDSRAALRKLAAQRQIDSQIKRDNDDYRALEMKSLQSTTDILVELLERRVNGRNELFAKAIDLRNESILAFATTEGINNRKEKIHIPGSNVTLKEKRNEDKMELLVELLTEQLIETLK